MGFDTVPWLRHLPHPRLPEDETLYPHRWLALYVVSMSVFLIALDITIVGVTAPNLSKGLGATATQIQWAFDAYTVVLAGFVVLGGELAERYGRKGLVQIGMLVFAFGSAVSAFASSPGILIVGRVISGLGAAVVFPTCLAIVSALFPPEERHRAIAIFASISAGGLAGGPLIGGLLINMVSRQIGGAIGVAITGSVASIVYRSGLSLGSFPLDAAEQSRVESSLSDVIALNNKLGAATACALMPWRMPPCSEASQLRWLSRSC
jgi:MFS family permease